ncbi:MAG: LysR family transcriptional regulator [Hyphomonas sp.]|nr:LysR family transcriptional regulator [Hyphomonas sp.]
MTRGTVSAAAQGLGVSQPAVTKSIKQLEDELGYLLFDRLGGRLVPTEAASALLQETERAQAALEDLRSEAIRLRAGTQRHLRLVSIPSLGLDVVPDAVAAHLAEAPDTRFTISTRHSGEMLAEISKSAYGFDLGFVYDASTRPASVGATEIGQVQVVCVAQRGLMSGAAPIEVEARVFSGGAIGLEDSEPLGRMLLGFGSAKSVTIDPELRVQSYQMAAALARRGCGIAVVDGMTGLYMTERDEGLDLLALPENYVMPVNVVYPLAKGLTILAREFVDQFSGMLAARSDQLKRRLSGPLE